MIGYVLVMRTWFVLVMRTWFSSKTTDEKQSNKTYLSLRPWARRLQGRCCGQEATVAASRSITVALHWPGSYTGVAVAKPQQLQRPGGLQERSSGQQTGIQGLQRPGTSQYRFQALLWPRTRSSSFFIFPYTIALVNFLVAVDVDHLFVQYDILLKVFRWFTTRI